MGWRVQMAMTGEVLERIVWLLLALADLAERAAFAPAARRRLVLAILRSGETVACDAFASRATHAACIQAAPGETPEDALALAMSRALALIVRTLATPLRRLSRRMAGRDRNGSGRDVHASYRAFIVRAAGAACPPARRLDTS